MFTHGEVLRGLHRASFAPGMSRHSMTARFRSEQYNLHLQRLATCARISKIK